MALGSVSEGSLDDKIFEAVSTGIVCFDGGGGGGDGENLRILRCNRTGARAIGAAAAGADGVTGKFFDEVVKADFDGLKVAFRKVLEDKTPLTFWGCPLTDAETGEKTFWDYTVSVIEDGILLLSAVEVTDRIEGERSLQSAVEDARQSASRLQSVVAQMSDGVIVFDASGEPIKINQAARDLLGEAASIFQPKQKKTKRKTPLITRLDGKTFPPGKYPWQMAYAKGRESVNVEMRVRRRADSEAIICINAAPLRDRDDNVSGAVVVLHDVTENRKLIDELREANRRLEEYNRLKAEFVANMSHELRTPLTAIIGFAQLMQMKTRKGDFSPETVTDGLERILRNGRHLLSLIDEVLDLSKIEAGRLTLHLEHFDIPEMVEKTFGNLEALALGKNLKYSLKISGDFPFAYGDPARIRQILLNLISNAIKFTDSGSIDVELRSEDRQKWQVVVRDTGIGIKAENLDKVFERFRQVDGSYTRTVGGFGLGLAISQQLANLLGGAITVESSYKKGSTFTLTLPFEVPQAQKTLIAVSAHQQQSSHSQPRREEPLSVAPGARSEEEKDKAAGLGIAAAADGEKPVVLVIDDIPDSTRLLTETLENAGYRVSVAHSGSEGILLARELHPVAVTLDVMMPGMDGWRVLQAMKTDSQLAQIPVVVVSIVDNKPLGYRLGASGYLVKPVEPGNLLNTLNAVMTAPGEKTANEYILVVDDEYGVRELLISALKQGGFKTRSAASGELAFSMAVKRPPLAILTDLYMPGGMSGFELIARLRAEPKTASIPIVVITGKDLLAEDRHFISGQIADVIRKGDLMLSNLDERLRETLEEIGVEPTNGKNNAG
ncbi:MAG: response regulator [Acidobacteriota bacterium]|nr:response regulator [Acidobacteriota bacterium]